LIAGILTPDSGRILYDFGASVGAIQAIEEAGKKSGKDIVVISIDGVRSAFDAMVEGKLNCTVECNPLIGPQLFDAIETVMAGKSVPKRINVQESVYDETVAKDVIGSRKY
ncbi:MAG TPA: hypothetical protein VHP11_01465, partial [Tepidisphaeraceae bacterium]|nr:hypothetical protein [Tepidisphaeraceae bacterium]